MPAIIDKIADALHLHKHKDEPASASATPAATSSASAATKTEAAQPASPAFDKSKVTVLFVLGGPGAGEHFCCSLRNAS